MVTLTDAPAPPTLTLPQQPARPRRRSRGALVGKIAGYGAMIVAAAALLLPFYWMVMSSLKENNEVFTIPIKWVPQGGLVWSNYVDIWSQGDMLTWIKNTLIIAVSVTFLQVLTGSFAAYGFSRVRFRGRDTLFLAYIATIAVPWQSYMIPQFILMSKIHLTDSLWSIIVLQAFGAFGVFLMKQFFETVPEELSEAARIDGLSEYGIYRRIMLPLSKPAIASLTLLTFVGAWNDYLGPLIYLRDPKLWTIQIGLKSFISQYNANDAWIMAGSVVSILPVAIIFLFGQRYFIEGIATTGLKG